MDKTVIIRKIALALMTVLILAYIVSVILKANFTQIKTESANIMTVSESIPTSGYFIRDEQLVIHEGSGFISYVAADGEKISKNEPVANVFTSADEANEKKKTDDLEAQITKLQQLDKTAATISATPDALDKSIDTILSQINMNVTDRNFTDAQSNLDTLLYTINERQVVTGKVEGFGEKITQLQTEVSSRKKGAATVKGNSYVTSPATGYFVSSADGYEGVCTPEQLDALMPGDLSEDKLNKKAVADNVVGKIVEGVSWYVACEVSGEDALRIKNASDLCLDIPLANTRKIDVELYSINQKTKTSEAVVIFRGEFMNAEMANIRREDISIVLNTYTGIYVSKNAVHEEQITETSTDKNGKETSEIKTVTGVYIQIGNELLFKQIVPLYTGNDFVVCKSNPKSEELVTDEVGILKPYDDVVVEGANLYDGKIINRTN